VAAAVAALATILYARSTVQEARGARQESHRDHLQEAEAQTAFLNASSAQHQEEMAEWRRAFEAETKLQRLTQIERIAEAVLDVITAARQEHVAPSPKIAEPMPFRATIIPAVLARLRASVAVLDALDGPHMDAVSKLAEMSYGAGDHAMPIVGAGIGALREIEWAIRRESEPVDT
jgi:hypothetical protein